MKPPCDEAVIRSMSAAAPWRPEVKRWVLAAAVLGSSMTFLDSAVVNVALPAVQTSLGATVVGVQWVVESYGLFQRALILACVMVSQPSHKPECARMPPNISTPNGHFRLTSVPVARG
jgi:hypothetical protein